MCPTWDVGKVGAMMQGVNFSRFKGFTLVELLVTVALAALLAGLAAPSFMRFMARSEMTAVVNDFSGAIQSARMEAISRNQCVSVCRRASDSLSCAAEDGSWNKGWIVYENPSCSADVEVNPVADRVLRSHGKVPATLMLNGETGDAPSVVVFTPRGLPLNISMAMRMAFTDLRGEQAAPERIMALSATGRLRPTVRQAKPDDPVVAEGQ